MYPQSSTASPRYPEPLPVATSARAPAGTPERLLQVEDLAIHAGAHCLLQAISLQVHRGQSLILLGESGAGKSLLTQAIMGNLPRALKASGRITLAGHSSAADHLTARRHLWGRTLSLLPQEPVQALNPLMRIQTQLAEVHRRVLGRPRLQAAKQALQQLEQAGLADAAGRYPWQISGGMAQRAATRIALAGGAHILLADEPTKGLDRHWANEALRSFETIREAGGCVIVITHDLRIARALGGQLMVLQHGQCVEQGEVQQILDAPQHPFTRQLIGVDPARWDFPVAEADNGSGRSDSKYHGSHHTGENHPGTTPVISTGTTDSHGEDTPPTCNLHAETGETAAESASGAERTLCSTAPVLEAQGLTKSFGGRTLFTGLDLKIHRHDRLVLQGASGVGKSTLGNILLGLMPADAGRVQRDPGLPPFALQKLYQDPVTAFAPHATLKQLLGDVVKRHQRSWRELEALLERLNIPASLLERRATEVSGGELQRVALARTLIMRPALLFADEPTSRLDPVTQREAMQLLLECVAEQQSGLILVTHDEDMACRVATRILRFGDEGLVAEA